MHHCRAVADDGYVNVFRKKSQKPLPAARPNFGAWLLRQFAGEQPMASMPFAEVERICASAGSVLFGAAYARPDAFVRDADGETLWRTEAALLSRRTADG